jgi:L-ascorbate metabolism protein UlaG (beta-lactamase superfamily)
MATRVRWLGHACLLIESDGQKILIDPFLTGNPAAAIKAEEVSADFILISHGHGDHVGDAVAIAKRTGATVIANYEIAGWLTQQGLTKTHGQQHGGSHAFPFGRVKLTLAFHGSALPIHYNTWDLIAQDAQAWAARVRKETKAQPVVLKPGEWTDV